MSVDQLLSDLSRAVDALPEPERTDAAVAQSLLTTLFADHPSKVSEALEAGG